MDGLREFDTQALATEIVVSWVHVKLEPYLYRFPQMSSLIATSGIGDEIYSVPGGRLAGRI
ncbi:hypothetical protein CN177_13110 [Sinorhizobium meliloti]|nr:hypothetical protein CN219_22630 [Sinorhizobium meliloti]RVI33397.1 hypothetical protein CN197_18035 [Sinorhizobium meliloti]RVI46545.1 hypothetical protein CN196_09570 [Sinorhizobium meliloti]RVJ25821.1 hypothetical protein CN177_13110 [Sinorhizobium meliloti]RVK00648.1 hypothetical protein CN170_12550 [Sinorhizobium meliloti]